ncbi:MFS transporter [Oceanicoccus sp. KOV_DT_Chl]|uniref:MFS transporter n=1 Tax=Oceanicoccus sp. KOV_DT_Chl TaxID=1904639 RepID=UPI000C7B0E08|nr:MFS transporter [Oceanicoccus sp. KOV_DT_Chl]
MMKKSLAKIRGFLPYVILLFLNAFVDQGHKMLIQNTVFKVYDGYYQVVLTAIVNALILLPFILLFSPAGFCSDRWPKNNIMRIAAWLAVALTLLITLFYYLGWFWAAFGMTFLLASQSAFYSPAKYGYIRALVGADRLTAANGVVQATTITAILVGTFVMSILFEWHYATVGENNETAILQAFAPVGWLLVLNSVVELIMAYRLPELEQPKPELRFSLKEYITGQDIAKAIKPVYSHPVIVVAIVGLAGFWSVSQLMLAAFPAFAKADLGETNTVFIQGVMAVTGIGIMVGALLAAKFTRSEHADAVFNIRWLSLPALGIALCLLWLPILPALWFHGINFFVIGICGGLFIVPLNSIIQYYGDPQHLGKILAANNLGRILACLVFY